MLQKINLQYKLIISFTLPILISFLALTLFFYQYVRNYTDRDSRKSMEDIAQSINNQLDGEIYSLDRIALGMLGNKELIDGLTRLDIHDGKNSAALALEKYEFQKLVDKLIFTLNTPILTSPMISVFNPGKDYFFAWSISGLDQTTVNTNLYRLDWQEKVAEMSGGKVLLPPRQNEWTSKPDTVFSVARAIMTSKGQFLGLLEVQQKYSVLEKICSPNSDTWVTIVLDDQGNRIYPLETGGLDEALQKMLRSTRADGELDFDAVSETYIISGADSEYTGWKTVVLRPKQEVFKATALLFQFILYAILAILLLVLAAVILISKTLTRPIRKLRASMETVDIGQMDVKLDSEPGNDEIYLINRSFERMIERIDLSVKQRVQAQQEEARAYLLALQSQTNPHFLYNTLNTISVLADENGQEVIFKISTHLVDMLRYVSDYNNTKVPLQSEIKYAQQYLYLLKTRYEDKLAFDFSIEGTPEQVMVPKLILQPLVENGYRHGLLSVPPPWKIGVTVEAYSSYFKITVTDNGGGFSPEVIDELTRRMENFRISDNPALELKNIRLDNVGLFNTYSRLYLEYGGNVNIIITNNEPKGSSVTITVRFPSAGDTEETEETAT